MFEVKSSGSFKNTENFLRNVSGGRLYSDLERYGRMGADVLSKNTPNDTGETATSWGYEIIREPPNRYGIIWTNDNVNDGVNVAVIIQYGHGTGTGGYVEGIDYINPALRPVFDAIAEDVWKKVTRG